MTKENLLQHLQECCDRMFGCSLEMATEKQVYRAVCVAVRELLEDDSRAYLNRTQDLAMAVWAVWPPAIWMRRPA